VGQWTCSLATWCWRLWGEGPHVKHQPRSKSGRAISKGTGTSPWALSSAMVGFAQKLHHLGGGRAFTLLAQAAVRLLELRSSRTFLDQLRPQLFRLGDPTQSAANTCRPRSDRFWLLELRVSQHFSTFYGPSVQAMDTQLGARHRRWTPTIVGRGAWSVRGKWSWGDAPGDCATVPFHCSAVPLLFPPTPGLTGNDLRRIVRLELLPDECSARDGGRESHPPGIATPVPTIA
jgi:hypothetical protein